jgi:hypothetical protein
MGASEKRPNEDHLVYRYNLTFNIDGKNSIRCRKNSIISNTFHCARKLLINRWNKPNIAIIRWNYIQIFVRSMVFLRMNLPVPICSISISRIRHRTRGDGVPSARHNKVNGVPARIENNGGFGRKSVIRGGTKKTID